MRLIDADNLISVLDILCDKGGDIRYWEQLKWIVADVPTIEAEPRWIPVTERLPEYGENVLLQLRNNSMKDGFLKLIDGKYPMWDIEEFSSYLMQHEVIAWMPLPEPYKEVE